MPIIPLSNEQRQVRTPNVARQRAVDASPLIEAQGRDNQATISALGNLALGGLKAKEQVDRVRDADLRNAAELDYNERTSQLNEQLSTMTLENRQKFQPKYEAEMKKAQDQYEAQINKVKDYEIREGSKRSINGWNVHNASNYQYDNYKNDTAVYQQRMGQALVSNTRKLYSAITAADTADSVMALMNNPEFGFTHGEEQIRDFYGNRMGYPEEVVEQYVQDYKSKALVAAANRLAEVTDEVSKESAYDQSLELLNKGIQQGLIIPEDGVQMKRTLEDQKLDMIAAISPGSLINRDGSYNFTQAHKYAPDLTRKEIYKHISAAKNNSGSGAKEILNEYAQKGMDAMYDLLKEVGYAEDPTLLPDNVRAQFAGEVAGQNNHKRQNFFGNVRAFNMATMLKNGHVVIEADGTARNLTDNDNVEELVKNGAKIFQKADDDKLNNIRRIMIGKIVDEGLNGGLELYNQSSWNPLARNYNLSKQDKTTLDLLNKYLQQFPKKNSAFFGSVGAKVSNIMNFGWNYQQTAATPNYEVVSGIISGIETGLGKAASLYGVDTQSSAKDMGQAISKMEWTKDKNGNVVAQVVEGAPKTTFGNEAANAIALEWVNILPDEVFKHMTNGKSKDQVKSEIEQYGGYTEDFLGGNADRYNWFNNYIAGSAAAQQMMPVGGILAGITRVGGALMQSAGVVPTDKALADNITAVKNFLTEQTQQAQQKQAMSGAAQELSRVQMSQDVYDDRTKEFFKTFATSNPNNAPFSFDQYVLKQGTATPEAYHNYLATRNNMLNSFAMIAGADLTNQQDPAKVFFVNDEEVGKRLFDEYTKQAIQYPSAYEDEFSVDKLANSSVELSQPQNLFEQAKRVEKPKDGYHLTNKNVIFLNDNGNGFLCKNGSVTMFSANHDNFMNLLGMVNSYQRQKGKIQLATPQTAQSWYNAIPKEQLPSDWRR